eukprot:scaffold25300_cov21-Tisochrysis_lutea.AAC.1
MDLVPYLLSAIADPNHATKPALEVLLQTVFVNTIDAASLVSGTEQNPCVFLRRGPWCVTDAWRKPICVGMLWNNSASMATPFLLLRGQWACPVGSCFSECQILHVCAALGKEHADVP